MNVTARLQEMTKVLGCEVVLSDEVCKTAGLAPDALPSTEVAIRGRVEPMIVRTAGKAVMLSKWVETGANPTPASAPTGGSS